MTDKEALKIYKEERRKQLKWKIKNFFEELPLKILALVTLILIVSIIAGPVIIGALINNLVLEIIGAIWIGVLILVGIIGCIVEEIKWHLTKKKMEIERIKWMHENE